MNEKSNIFLCIVSVKWNKLSFDVDVEPSLGVEVLKAQLFDLSNVPVDKQKLMFKGKILKVRISFMHYYSLLARSHVSE